MIFLLEMSETILLSTDRAAAGSSTAGKKEWIALPFIFSDNDYGL